MKSSTSAPRDCAGLAPQLTALFDGEADAAQARDARAHLLVCPACSRLWLDWTRHRDTLQSEPPPAIPPTLLWRVLIATRVAAFARPARRRSRLPMVTATPLRGIEAPLPPRLSEHILARTTRKPNAHVMLTPMNGVTPVATGRNNANWKARTFTFRRAPLWAAPALALWILMLGRADFNATVPTATPDAAVVVAPAPLVNIAPTNVKSTTRSTVENEVITPIPVASLPVITSSSRTTAAPRVGTVAPIVVPVAVAPVAVAPVAVAPVAVAPVAVAPVAVAPIARRIATPVVAGEGVLNRGEGERIASASVARAQSTRGSARADVGLGRAFLLAMNAGQRDIMRARTAPRPALGTAPVAPVSRAPVAAPAPRPQAPAATPAKAAPRAIRTARRVPEDVANSRVTLAALASPTSPIRTFSSARLRSAAFSEDSLRPRVAHLSAGGRRLTRLMPDEGTIPLRVSRPIAGAPTLRPTSLNAGDNGPKLDELRSAVDDFRASVAGNDLF